MKIKIDITHCYAEENDNYNWYKYTELAGFQTEIEVDDTESFQSMVSEIRQLFPFWIDDLDFISGDQLINYTTFIGFKLFDNNKGGYERWFDAIIFTGGYYIENMELITPILKKYLCQ